MENNKIIHYHDTLIRLGKMVVLHWNGQWRMSL